jgi:hypothetical protein
MQSIIRTIAKRNAACAVVNDERTDEKTADKNYTIGQAREKKLLKLLERLEGKEKLCDDELLAVDDLILDPNEPPKFADSFRARLFELRQSLR